MRKLLAVACAVSAFAIVPAAHAATTITFTPGSSVLAPGESVFADFDTTDGGVSGSNYVVKTGTDGDGADPAVGNQGDAYLSVLANGTANFNFAGGLSNIFLDYGSADDYNIFTLFLSDGSIDTFTGSQAILAGFANGDQQSPLTNGRLTFTAQNGALINSLSIASYQNSAEVDNLGTTAAVPEPATWAMMLFGFGAVGFGMRRRRRADKGQARVRFAV
jgi:hypothetical protein